MGKPARELAVIHVSLAATYTDLRRHGKAVEHYRKELALRQGNSVEVGVKLHCGVKSRSVYRHTPRKILFLWHLSDDGGDI